MWHPPRVHRLALLALLSLSCSSSSRGDATPPQQDPCAGVELPPCPEACAPERADKCGQPCDPAVDKPCGNNIGDGMTCVEGTWACTVHAPLAPTGCNLTCR